MRQILEDIYLMEGLRGCNVYLLISENGLTLVDSGLASDVTRIMMQIEKAGFHLERLQSIVLTHAHGDHIGSAAELVRRSGAQIIAHRDEVPFLEKSQTPSTGKASQSMLNWLGDHFVFRQSPLKVDRPVENGDVVAVMGGMQVIHTPGHTPGSKSLYHSERQLLFCGDAFFNMNPLTRKKGLRLPLRMVSLDNEQARDSAAKLTLLPVEVLCCGHGAPILQGAGVMMQSVLAR
jgi:glyoxylase-like metal-dependent hydrolase (beta-lactamase superfamily II)